MNSLLSLFTESPLTTGMAVLLAASLGSNAYLFSHVQSLSEEIGICTQANKQLSGENEFLRNQKQEVVDDCSTTFQAFRLNANETMAELRRDKRMLVAQLGIVKGELAQRMQLLELIRFGGMPQKWRTQ